MADKEIVGAAGGKVDAAATGGKLPRARSAGARGSRAAAAGAQATPAAANAGGINQPPPRPQLKAGDKDPITGEKLVAIDLADSVGYGGIRGGPLYGPGKGVLVPEGLAKQVKANRGVETDDDLPVSAAGFAQEQGGRLLGADELRQQEGERMQKAGKALADGMVSRPGDDQARNAELIGADVDAKRSTAARSSAGNSPKDGSAHFIPPHAKPSKASGEKGGGKAGGSTRGKGRGGKRGR